MRDYYSNNIRFLDPILVKRLGSLERGGLIFKETKSGVPSIVVKDKEGREVVLHSLDDPYLEAREFISGFKLKQDTLAIVLGFGLGYHIFELYSQLTSGKIIVIEEDLAIFKQALKLQNLVAILSSRDIELIVGEDKEKVIGRLGGIITIDKIEKVKVIVHPPSLHLNPEYYGYLKETIERGLEVRLANLVTQASYGEIWQRNIILNIPQIISNPPVESLYGEFFGKPAIIVSAGPSLDKNIDYLSMVRGRALLISVDTALRPLLLRDIRPDLVVSVDPQEVNYTHIDGLRVERMHLVADPIVYPSTISNFEGGKLIASHGHPLMDWVYSYLEFDGLKIEPLRTGGSVSTAAFDLARRIGADPIIFVGQDLSFPPTGQKFYAKGCVFLDGGYDGLKKFNTLRMRFRDLRPVIAEISTKDILNRDVLTNRKLMNYLRWFEEEVRHTKARCINATEGGILKKGFILMSLRDAIREYCKKELDIEGFLAQASRYYPRVDRLALRRGMDRIQKELLILDRICDEAINSGWNELERINMEIDNLSVTHLIKDTIEGILYGSLKDIGSFYKKVREMARRTAGLIEKVKVEL